MALLLALALWTAEVSPAIAIAGHLQGPAASAMVLRSVNDWFALGATIDSARLSASGSTPILPSPPGIAFGGAYTYAIASTFAGATAQFRLELGRFAASADLSAGWVEVRALRAENVDCSFSSGFNARLGAGLTFAATEHVVLGLRAAARAPATMQACTQMIGRWNPGFSAITSLGPSLSARF